MDKLPTWFQLDYWYKVFVIGGAAGTATALVFDLKAIDNTHALLLFLGMFFIGIGEWINHPIQTRLIPRTAFHPAGVTESHPRHPNALGTLFDLLGGALLAKALYEILQLG